jgi:membrane protease YdiL (CAAX protease family)
MPQYNTIKARNPVLVLIWTFGLFMLIQVYQYLGVLLSSIVCGGSFEAIIEGEFTNSCCVLWRGVAAAIVGIPLAVFVTRYLWRRSWEWMRFRFTLKLFVYGILLGLILPLLIIAIIFTMGMATVVATPARFSASELFSIIIGTLFLLGFIALAEELVFRGMALREWASKLGWPRAIVLSALYFGIVHVIGLLPRITPAEGAWIVLSGLIVGVLLASMYIRSRSLWLPIGFHFGWNLCLQLFLGTTISGHEANFGLFRTELSGPVILTGGTFGVESSVVTYVVYIAVTILFLSYAKSGRPELLDSRPE